MRLIEVRVKNYRSIIDSTSIPIKQISVIVGKNNQGKSNFVRAIDIAFQVIDFYSVYYDSKDLYNLDNLFKRDYLARGNIRRMYDYERDFPLHKKTLLKKPKYI